MVILRPTKRLQLLLPAAEVSADSTTALGDWYVNRFVADRHPLLLLVSSASLLPILIPARDVRSLPDRLGALVESRLRRCGVERLAIALEVQAMRPVAVAPTVNRSVLGVMADFARNAPYWLEPGPLTLENLEFIEESLGRTPCHAGKALARVIIPCEKAPQLLHAKWLASAPPRPTPSGAVH